MKNTGRLICVLLTVVILGCGEGGKGFSIKGMMKTANETKAMSILKMLQTASAVYQCEREGIYGTIKELHDSGGMISESIYQAWDRQEKPTPISGYLVADIATDSGGIPLNRRERSGFAAYPVKPGVTGDSIILMLCDQRNLKAPQGGEGGFVSHGEEWTFFKADYAKIGGPVRCFPGDNELRTKWTALKKYTPQEGLEEAKKISNQAR